jgi:hypothetical protein
MLTKDEKLQIINSHRKNLSYSKYNLDIDFIQENAKSTPDPIVLSTIEQELEELDNQLTALNTEATAVANLVE